MSFLSAEPIDLLVTDVVFPLHGFNCRVAVVRKFGAGSNVENEPLPVAINSRPNGLFTESITSPASPAPDIQMPEPDPFGVLQYALICCNVEAL